MSDPLKIWAEELFLDGLTNLYQRRTLNTEEFRDGVLNLVTFTAQQYNQLMYQVTSHSNPFDLSPYRMLSTTATPDEALELNGQTISAIAYPKLAAEYTTTLPDLSAEVAGWKWVVRKQ